MIRHPASVSAPTPTREPHTGSARRLDVARRVTSAPATRSAARRHLTDRAGPVRPGLGGQRHPVCSGTGSLSIWGACSGPFEWFDSWRSRSRRRQRNAVMSRTPSGCGIDSVSDFWREWSSPGSSVLALAERVTALPIARSGRRALPLTPRCSAVPGEAGGAFPKTRGRWCRPASRDSSTDDLGGIGGVRIGRRERTAV